MSKRTEMNIDFMYLADDFFVLAVLAKNTSENSNRALPWVFSHVIELSVKSNCIRMGESSIGHDLSTLWEKIKEKFSDQSIWPEKKHFKMYKKVFVPGNLENAEINGLPLPEDLFKSELAYWIDNVRDLKYGFDLKGTMISQVHLSYDGMNPEFIKLFRGLRNEYKNENLDRRFVEKIHSLFSNVDFRNQIVSMLIK